MPLKHLLQLQRPSWAQLTPDSGLSHKLLLLLPLLLLLLQRLLHMLLTWLRAVGRPSR